MRRHGSQKDAKDRDRSIHPSIQTQQSKNTLTIHHALDELRHFGHAKRNGKHITVLAHLLFIHLSKKKERRRANMRYTAATAKENKRRHARISSCGLFPLLRPLPFLSKHTTYQVHCSFFNVHLVCFALLCFSLGCYHLLL